MPKYFFHYRDGSQWTMDDVGVEFSNVEAAYLAAYDAAVEMWPELLRARHDPRQCIFEINDEMGKTMFTLPFSEILDSCREQVPGHVPTRTFRAVLSARARLHHSIVDFRRELRCTHRTLAEARTLITAATELVGSSHLLP